MVSWISVLLYVILLLSYTAAIGPIISKEFRANVATYKTKKSLRSPKCLPVAYRSIEIMHRFAVQIFGRIIIPIEALLSQFIVFCNFLLIRYWSEIDSTTRVLLGFLTVTFEILWMAFLQYGGLFHMHAKRTIKSWTLMHFNNQIEAKFMMRFRKSCRPLSVGTVGYYTITRVTVLRFLQGTLRKTFRALLTL